MTLEGWIDEVTDGIVWGRILYEGAECEFSTPLLSVAECQRVDLEPGSWITIVNGYIAVNKVMWTTQELEDADARADKWATAFAAGQRPLGAEFEKVLMDNLPDLYVR